MPIIGNWVIVDGGLYVMYVCTECHSYNYIKYLHKRSCVYQKISDNKIHNIKGGFRQPRYLYMSLMLLKNKILPNPVIEHVFKQPHLNKLLKNIKKILEKYLLEIVSFQKNM